jgi:outer membrane protein OmpA-like peptidoglycan-associated protein
MYTMKKLLFILLLISSSLLAQQNKIVFDNTSHNFGNILEKDGKVHHVFRFVNEGSEAVSINKIFTTCGCTTTDWTVSPVEPGTEGYIVVEFDPASRQGRFMNALTVSTSDNPSNEHKLYIRGIVAKEQEQLASTLQDSQSEQKQEQYIHYFTYNSKKILSHNIDFQEFVDRVAPIARQQGKVTILIESSASHVPTDLFKHNESLAAYRANEARKLVLNALEQKGIEPARVEFKADKNLVQGPLYNNDSEENISVYQQYQYVKIAAF